MNSQSDQPTSNQNPNQQKIPAEGVFIFSTSEIINQTRPYPSTVQVILEDKHIEQTGIAPQNNDLFSLQVVLNGEGIKQLTQWKARLKGAGLFLAVNGFPVSQNPIVMVDEDTVELPGLDFDTVYNLAGILGYDKKALQGLARLAPANKLIVDNVEKTLFTNWKIVGKNSEFLGEILNDIQDILTNRAEGLFGGDVIFQREKSALYIGASPRVSKSDLLRMVSTRGQIHCQKKPSRSSTRNIFPAPCSNPITKAP